jgi:ABC-type branched-subunit amino acid transport system substrate-binding protein
MGLFGALTTVTILLLAGSCCLAQAAVSSHTSTATRIVMEDPLHKRQGLPMIRIGTTYIFFGPNVSWGELLRNTWKLFNEKSLTITVGGTLYGVQVIAYADDGTDVATTVALVKTLALVDKVHMLSCAYSGTTVTAFVPTAEAMGIPTLCGGSYSVGNLPPGSLFWTVNILPSIATLGYECALPLVQAGARNFTYIIANTTLNTPASYSLPTAIISALKAGGLNHTLPLLIVPDDSWTNPDLLDPVIRAAAAANPDLAVFDFGQPNNIIFLNRMRRNNWNPKAYFVWGTGSYPQLRQNLTWGSAGSLISEAYQADLNASDPLWGSSLEYDAVVQSRFGLQSANADANQAAALTIMVYALRVTTDLSPASLRTAVLSFRGTTLVGNLSFTGNAVNRALYCFQNNFPNASGILTVWPPTVPAYTKLVYPAIITYPAGYFDQFRTARDLTFAWIIAGIGGTLLLVGVIVAGFFFVWTRMYNVVNIPKNPNNTEWGST